MSKSIYGKLDPYKTAHEKLIERGFKESPCYNERCYFLDNDEQYIEIYINIRDVCYYVPNNENIDLELSRILTQYLEELENEMGWKEKIERKESVRNVC